MAAITRSRTVPADQQAVWKVLADFGALSSWVANVGHSAVLVDRGGARVGTSRRVQVGRDALVETITDVVDRVTLAYDIEGMPPRLGRLNNRWTLDSAGSDTVVTVTSTIHVAKGPVAAATALVVGRVMAKMADEMLAGLARRMEDPRDH